MADNLELEMKTLTLALTSATDEVKKQAEATNSEIKNLGKVTEETKENADRALLAMGTIDTRLTEIEQKMSRRGQDEPPEFKSLGQQVVDNDEVKAALEQGDRFKGRINVELKNITSVSTTGTSATTGLVVADRQGFLQLPNRPLMVRDLLMPGRTNSGNIEYPKEVLFTNSAATVAENPGTPKPQSDITYTLVNTPVRTIAHFIKASRQIMADAPQLQSQIDGRLRYGLGYAEDHQLLLGDGTGTNLNGMMPQATAYAAATTGITESASVTKIDRLRLALLQATLALYPSTGIVLNPADWAGIELTKDTQGRYIFANPTAMAGPVMWGKPVVESLAMTVNLFLVGAFKMAVQIFDREDANVMISSEDQDNFVKNMVTILAEERLALAVYRPSALIKGNFTGAA
jgi:HK97 family phage major capsid protein